MISDQAKKGIDHIFMMSAKSRLALDSGDTCAIEPMKESKLNEMPEKNIVVLTISSMQFRLLMIFHIDENPATRAYFVRDAKDKTFGDVFSEVGNLCCGAMNHELLRHFPHLGMSTPYTLSSQCVAYLGELKPGYLSRYAITINGSVQLHATLCVCEYAPLDFAVDTTAAQEETGGLELF